MELEDPVTERKRSEKRQRDLARRVRAERARRLVEEVLTPEELASDRKDDEVSAFDKWLVTRLWKAFDSADDIANAWLKQREW